MSSIVTRLGFLAPGALAAAVILVSTLRVTKSAPGSASENLCR